MRCFTQLLRTLAAAIILTLLAAITVPLVVAPCRAESTDEFIRRIFREGDQRREAEKRWLQEQVDRARRDRIELEEQRMRDAYLSHINDRCAPCPPPIYGHDRDNCRDRYQGSPDDYFSPERDPYHGDNWLK